MSNPRPTGPELELLAEIVSEHDRRMDEAGTADEKDEVWLTIVGGIIPADVLAYVAFQRAIRKMGVTTTSELAEQVPRATELSAAWIDGFTAGAAYQERTRQVSKRDVHQQVHDEKKDAISLELEIENNTYKDGNTVTTHARTTVPAPWGKEDSDERSAWEQEYIFPLTGTGRDEGDSWYDVEVTGSDRPDLIPVGTTYEFGY